MKFVVAPAQRVRPELLRCAELSVRQVVTIQTKQDWADLLFIMRGVGAAPMGPGAIFEIKGSTSS